MTTETPKTLDVTCDYHEYRDFLAPREAEVCRWEGRGLVAVQVCPRGFANEVGVNLADAAEPEEVAELVRLIKRQYDAQPGDDFSARWMSRREISVHLVSQQRRNREVRTVGGRHLTGPAA